MSWMFVAQVSALAVVLGVVVVVCGSALHGSVVDKRREDAHRRKENGL